MSTCTQCLGRLSELRSRLDAIRQRHQEQAWLISGLMGSFVDTQCEGSQYVHGGYVTLHHAHVHTEMHKFKNFIRTPNESFLNKIWGVRHAKRQAYTPRTCR